MSERIEKALEDLKSVLLEELGAGFEVANIRVDEEGCHLEAMKTSDIYIPSKDD